MNISITDKNGVTLKTQNKYCPEDVSVKPVLQTKTATANGDISPDDGYCGLEKVTVNVPAMPTQEKTITVTENGTQEVVPDSGNVLSKVTVTTNVSSGLAIKGLVEQYTIQAGETISAGNFVEWISSYVNATISNVNNFSSSSWHFDGIKDIQLLNDTTVVLIQSENWDYSTYYGYLRVLKIVNNTVQVGQPYLLWQTSSNYNGKFVNCGDNKILTYALSETKLWRVTSNGTFELLSTLNKTFYGSIVQLTDTKFLGSSGSVFTFITINDNEISLSNDITISDTYSSNAILLSDNRILYCTLYTEYRIGGYYYSYTYLTLCRYDIVSETVYRITQFEDGYYSYNRKFVNFAVSSNESDIIVVADYSSNTPKLGRFSLTNDVIRKIGNIDTIENFTPRVVKAIGDTFVIAGHVNSNAAAELCKVTSDNSLTQYSLTEYPMGTTVTNAVNSGYNTLLTSVQISNRSVSLLSLAVNGDKITFSTEPYNRIVRAASNNVPVGIAAQSGVGGDIINVYVPTQLWLSAPQISIADNTISWNAVENAVNYGVYDNDILISTQTSTTYSLTNLSYGSHKIAVKALATTEYDISPQSNILDFIWNVYNVTTNLTNITANTSNPTTVSTVASSTLIFTANTGYNLPDNVTVTGAEFTWTKSSGTLVLSNPTGDVSVIIAGVAISYTITPNLTNVKAASENAATIATGETKILTYTAAEGYTLPDSVTVTGATGVWNKDAGTLTLSNPTANVTFTIAGVAIPQQTTPVISLVSGTTIQVDAIDDNATTIEVYADGTKIGEVAKQ